MSRIKYFRENVRTCCVGNLCLLPSNLILCHSLLFSEVLLQLKQFLNRNYGGSITFFSSFSVTMPQNMTLLTVFYRSEYLILPDSTLKTNISKSG